MSSELNFGTIEGKSSPWVSPECIEASWITERAVTFKVVWAFDASIWDSLDWVTNDSDTLTLGVKWQNDTKEVKHMPSLFTVASPDRVLVIRYPETDPPSEPLATFLQGHEFYMMTTLAATRKMRDKFGLQFPTEQFHDVKTEALQQLSERRFKELMKGFVAPIEGTWWLQWRVETLLVGQVMCLVSDAYALQRLVEAQRTASLNIEPVDEIDASIDEPPLAQNKFTWMDSLGMSVINTVLRIANATFRDVVEIQEMGMKFYVKGRSKVYPVGTGVMVPGEPLYRTYGRIAARAILRTARGWEYSCPWLDGPHSMVHIRTTHGKLKITGVGRSMGQQPWFPVPQ